MDVLQNFKTVKKSHFKKTKLKLTVLLFQQSNQMESLTFRRIRFSQHRNGAQCDIVKFVDFDSSPNQYQHVKQTSLKYTKKKTHQTEKKILYCDFIL